MNTRKKRKPIDKEISSDVLFLSDNTCCVCNNRENPIHIHHIDEDNTNNDEKNLAVLCILCHHKTMIKGGFGRRLDADQIIRYRDNWVKTVREKRKNAKEIVSIESVIEGENGKAIKNATEHSDLSYVTYEDPNILVNYLEKILIVHKAQLGLVNAKWARPDNLTIAMRNGEIISFYEEVLVELSRFYPVGYFKRQLPQKYFNEHISNLFIWYGFIFNPKIVRGMNSTIVPPLISYKIIDEIKGMIINMVESLAFCYYEHFGIRNFQQWSEEWLNTK